MIFLIDRMFPSEMIYGPFYRGYEAKYHKEMVDQFNELEGALIITTSTIEAATERFDGKFINIKDIKKLLTMYQNYFDSVNISNKIMIDTTIDSPTECFDKILNSPVLDKVLNNTRV